MIDPNLPIMSDDDWRALAKEHADIRDKIAQTGDVPAGTQAEFADLLKGEHVRWERTVKAANITPN